MEGYDLFEKYCLRASNIFNRLAGHGVGKEADEIARMSGLERDADFAVGLETSDAGTVPGPRIDDDERTPCLIDCDTRGRNDPHEAIIDGPLEFTAVHNELYLVVQHIRSGLGQMFMILIATLTHDVPEQYAALCCIDRIFHGRGKQAEPRRKHTNRTRSFLTGRHYLSSCVALRFGQPLVRYPPCGFLQLVFRRKCISSGLMVILPRRVLLQQ